MNILIYGEFSGYGKSLSKGFEALGYNCEVFSPNGDGFKKIESSLTLKSKSIFFKIIELMLLIPSLSKFDKILIMNPSFFSIFKGFGIFPLLFFILKRKDLYLICCGDDVEYIRAGENGIISKYIYESSLYPKAKYFKRKLDFFVNYLCGRYSKFIVPVMYDYEVAWKTSNFREKVTNVIPLACHVEAIHNYKATDYNEINILHGINRPDVKGSAKIISALQRIAKDFNNVIIHLPEQLPQKDYLDMFKKIDIAIDQCKCHGYGMNAIYSMMNAHIVLAPSDEFYLESLGLKSSPVISIKFDEDDIYEKLSSLIKRQDLDLIKLDTKKYADEIHNCQTIAKMFTLYLLK